MSTGSMLQAANSGNEGESVRAAIPSIQECPEKPSVQSSAPFQSLCREHPAEARRLARTFDAKHPGLNLITVRMFTRRATKIRWVLQGGQEPCIGTGRWSIWSRKPRLLLSVAVMVLLLPMFLSPTHPVAVYGYLASLYQLSITSEVYAASPDGFHAFLTSSEQVARYRRGLLEDMLDGRSSKLFVIVRRDDGSYGHEPVRTWNDFLPARLPISLSRWLDRKEFPFLGDKVSIWLRGDDIVATGHYHAFGGPPSAGDRLAQDWSKSSEVVVANGLIPLIFVDGEIVIYGNDTVVPEQIYLPLRMLEPSLKMDSRPRIAPANSPTPVLRSFLGFLHTYRDVDVNSISSVATGVRLLLDAFREEHRSVFTRGSHSWDYAEDLDMYTCLHHLEIIEQWTRRIPDLIRRDPNFYQ